MTVKKQAQYIDEKIREIRASVQPLFLCKRGNK
jgi:hypothetical protein